MTEWRPASRSRLARAIRCPCTGVPKARSATSEDEKAASASAKSPGSWLAPSMHSYAFQMAGGGNSDAFLVRFDTAGQVVWSTYIGGSGDESVFGPVLGPNGGVIVGGYTTSANFFTTADVV